MGTKAFTLIATISIMLAMICHFTMPTLFFGNDERKLLGTTRLLLVLLLLAWGPFTAFQFGHMTGLDTLFITSGQQELFHTVLSGQGISLLVLIQLSVIWIGALMAGVALIGLGWRVQRERTSIAGRKSYLFFGIYLVYPILNSWIVL
jgi:hypothetical protein